MEQNQSKQDQPMTDRTKAPGWRVKYVMCQHEELLPARRGDKEETVMRALTQKELADRIGISTNHLNFMLSGKRKLTEEHARAIAAYYNQSITEEEQKIRWQWLYGSDDYMTISEQQAAIAASTMDRVVDQYAGTVYRDGLLKDTFRRMGFTVSDQDGTIIAVIGTRTVTCNEVQKEKLIERINAYTRAIVCDYVVRYNETLAKVLKVDEGDTATKEELWNAFTGGI
jgi:DNA-binding transcriptional regulator YdaS (Cro superfamily)